MWKSESRVPVRHAFSNFLRHLNESAPFNIDEYEVVWKRPPYPPWGFDYYPDFNFTNSTSIAPIPISC